ncbi:MAG: hypothetical protein LBQ54_15135 [Planctomycetaceae bacterium]|jgi:hypothetical protein|nr:hypothetical protein [Planctomycetaceae bacterium]
MSLSNFSKSITTLQLFTFRKKLMRMVFSLLFVVLFLFANSAFAQELPPLVGDGIADDTAAIQARLDSETTLVYLPPPKKCYLISKAIKIHSNQTLRLDPNTIVRRADGMNDYMILNSEIVKGNRNISVIGGIWDGNNAANNCRYLLEKASRTIKHHGEIFMGTSLLMLHVENLRLENITVKDPVLFGIQIGGCRKFTVNDITFDYNLKNPSMDGVHIQGSCSEGRVTNIKGDTNDDMVALNADDVPIFDVTPGPITDIEIDGLFVTEKCFRGVRMLSTGSPVKRISISNVFGPFYRNAVAFTHYQLPFHHVPRYEDITINNIFCSKLTAAERLDKAPHILMRKSLAIIELEGELSVDNLTISNIHRREYLPDAAPTLFFRRGTKVGTLRLRDIQQVNATDVPLPFFRNEASIMKMFTDGVVIREKTVDEAIPLTGEGKIVKQYGEILVEGEQELLDESNRLDEELKTKPADKTII